MSRKGLTVIKVRAAPRGSKAGWPTVSGQVPPEVLVRLDEMALRRMAARGDLVHEAVEEYLERADQKAA